MSPTKRTPGRSAVKSRLSRSGRVTTSSAGIVVRFLERGWIPKIPASRMILRTRPSDAAIPRRDNSASTRRNPFTPCESSWICVITPDSHTLRAVVGGIVSRRFAHA